MSDLSFFEIGSGDAAVTCRFMSALFGWRFHPTKEEGPGWFDVPPARIGLHGDDPDRAITAYFRVDDIDAAAARVIELGGEAEPPGPAHPGFGRFCRCTDPQGVRFGLHQPEN